MEQRLLGIMLDRPETIRAVSAVLGKSPPCFSRHGHSEVYRTILELGAATDPVMVSGRLSDEAKRSLERPDSYLAGCVDLSIGYNTPSQAEQVARLLQSAHHVRTSLAACQNVTFAIQSGDDPSEELAHLANELDMARAGDTRIQPVTMAQLRSMTLIPPDPILGRGILSKGDWGLIHARENHGKTWAILELAACMATGRPWFGIDVPQRFRVGVFSLEMGRYFAFQRMDPIIQAVIDWESDAELAEAESWIFWVTKDEAPFFDILAPANQAWLCDWAASNKIDVLILDPLAQFFRGEETREGMAPLIEFLTTFPSRSGGCTPIVSHHDRKSGNQGDLGDHASTARGSVAFIGSARCSFHLVLRDVERKIVELVCDKASNAPKPEPIWLRHEDDGRLVLTKAPRTKAQEAVERAIAYLATVPEAGTDDVAAACSRTTEWARKRLKDLEEEGRVWAKKVRREDGKGWTTVWGLSERSNIQNADENGCLVDDNSSNGNYIDPF